MKFHFVSTDTLHYLAFSSGRYEKPKSGEGSGRRASTEPGEESNAGGRKGIIKNVK